MNQRTCRSAAAPDQQGGDSLLDEGTPLFVQIAEQLAAQIADGSLVEGDRVPSTNEFAAFHRINPATAAKGINLLVDQGLVEKRRGVGMFVVAGARARLLEQRREAFAAQFVVPLVTEARRIGIDAQTLVALVATQAAATAGGPPSVADTGSTPREVMDPTITVGAGHATVE